MKVDIYSLAATGESETVEFKKSTGQLHAAMETLCGFLNGAGGVVLFGVLDNGKVVGQPVSDKSMQEIAGALRKLEPAVQVGIDVVKLDNGNSVIALEVYPDRVNIPFAFEGKPYQRTGTMTYVMPQARYQTLLLERMSNVSRWENRVAEGYSIDDLDANVIRRIVRAGIEAGRLPDYSNSGIKEILEKLQLMDERGLYYAALVLFGEERALHNDFPQCEMRMARFAGKTKAEFLDNRQVRGGAFELLEEAVKFCARNLKIRGTFEEGKLQRKDVMQVPYKALREALINAICHRDYSVLGGAVSMAIYDDRLEVWSPGLLPFGTKLEQLKIDHTSKPRNPSIIDIFYKSNMIEKWGRGTQNMVEYCLAENVPEPEYFQQADSMVVRFWFAEEKDTAPVALHLTVAQRKIMDYVKANGKINNSQTQQLNEISEDSANRALKKLVEMGLLIKQGSARATVYLLAK